MKGICTSLSFFGLLTSLSKDRILEELLWVLVGLEDILIVLFQLVSIVGNAAKSVNSNFWLEICHCFDCLNCKMISARFVVDQHLERCGSGTFFDVPVLQEFSISLG